MTELYDSIYTTAVEIPLTPTELLDLLAWADEKGQDLRDLLRKVAMEAVHS